MTELLKFTRVATPVRTVIFDSIFTDVEEPIIVTQSARNYVFRTQTGFITQPLANNPEEITIRASYRPGDQPVGPTVKTWIFGFYRRVRQLAGDVWSINNGEVSLGDYFVTRVEHRFANLRQAANVDGVEPFVIYFLISCVEVNATYTEDKVIPIQPITTEPIDRPITPTTEVRVGSDPGRIA